ncbi:L-aspartate oxidase [Vreelandella jeotgali]|uniref:L-aspartate oxidase n=1 Tax=Vreelandella jeotgali TaxID=553386 RepID=UPI000346BAF3|nr:L-aspartate oxidase [Halomonas jeotgali]
MSASCSTPNVSGTALPETLHTDVVIIGGGAAGLTLALHLAGPFHVTLICPAGHERSGASRWAQGGIAAVLAPGDSVAAHVQDTLTAGDGLCDRAAVHFTVANSPAAIAWLLDCGVAFTPDTARDAPYPYHLTREGGHSARRIIHADDATGRAVVETLSRHVADHAQIRTLTRLTVTDLLQADDGACYGAVGVDDSGGRQRILARHTVLATGGASGLYAHTTTPAPASGEGMMMAAALGATLANLEFQQFHPTCLYDPDGPAFLISEAVRGEGGRLFNDAGERFMPAVDSRAELAPRDVVARAIDAEIQHGTSGHVWLDVRHLGTEAIHRHFPTIVAHCAERGLDMTRRPIPVVPAAHYSCGGIMTDLHGATAVPGLYAVGETACTGLHGANRMASNSLLECLVFARSCARHIREAPVADATATGAHASSDEPGDPAEEIPAAHQPLDTRALADLRHAMRTAMSRDVSIVRNRRGLDRAAEALDDILVGLLELDATLSHPQSRQLWHALRLAQLTVKAAAQRHESRGLHFSTDWPGQAAAPLPSRLSIDDLPTGTLVSHQRPGR